MSTQTLNLPEQTLRSADLATLVAVLKDQHAQKIDVVVPAKNLRTLGAALDVTSLPPQLTDAGVTDGNGLYRITHRAEWQLGDKLGIPPKYLASMRDNNLLALYDENVDAWARREEEDRKFLIRLMYGQDDANPMYTGVARAILSDGYAARDNLDTVMALLAGMREAGLDATNIGNADLSEERLYLRVEAPEISIMAPELLKGYRSPFTGAEGADNPVVYAGLKVTNSEVGNGALAITPELKIQVCSNGMVITKDAMRSVHLGQRLSEGTITWGRDTLDAEETLISKRVRDAVKSYLNPEYVRRTVDALTEQAQVKLDKPMDTVKVVAKELRFSEAESNSLLDHFVKGAQLTAGGVMQAVTSMCQTVEGVDRSHEVQAQGIRAMELAVKHRHTVSA